ncbi:MAG TPA: serine/threonine-protein kinase [Thermoanaerobaculia bacterium]|nr:serine/threonine-protein kinase [Thermoanaerobaculia bacterium]
MIARRYRIVALAGEGGMGEVYRADDMKLGQRVALKFIPQSIASDASAVERLYAEVRIGRRVAHPNVCRIYDVVETDGHRFISMEYVDGEDLASLLLRVGRVAPDKAMALTRDICAGLAAAHACGVIHRDLKPANVMIDGRGNARITDFGLAVMAGDSYREIAGTPAYMAPEQLTDGTATVRSDIYALGLLMFELFTGAAVFDGGTLEEVREQHGRPKVPPSSLVRGLDPAVDRLILRCAEEDPRARPSSMQEILASLPGGDRLEAALAAGETPSPEMIEAAQRTGALTVKQAGALLAALVALLLAATFVDQRAVLTWFAPEVKTRDALLDRARSVMRTLGYRAPPADWAAFSSRDFALLHTAYAGGGSSALPGAADWARQFHYRESPALLAAQNEFGRIREDDPPFVLQGMTEVVLDGQGRLRRFRSVPPARVDAAPLPFDWSDAFRDAGINPLRVSAVRPLEMPPVGADRRYAWTAAVDGASVRIEAATAGGRPVWFSVAPPWPSKGGRWLRPGGTGAGVAIIFVAAIAVGAFLARRNVLRDRADLRAARRLGMVTAGLYFAGCLFVADHVPALAEEWRILSILLGISLYYGLLIWLAHLAIEPYVRRRWPHMLVSSKRLLAGRFRDALVWADMLHGLVAGTLGTVCCVGLEALLVRAGLMMPRDPTGNTVAPMLGLPLFVFDHTALSIAYGFALVTLLVLARMIVRRDALAFGLLWILMALVGWDFGGDFLIDCTVRLVLFAPLAIALRRHGVLSLIVALWTTIVLLLSPLTFDWSRSYAPRGAMALVLIASIAVYAFRATLGGKQLFAHILVEEEATG